MKKIAGIFLLVFSFIPYAFMIFASFYMADRFNGLGNSFFIWIYAFWQAGIIPVSLVYQLLYFSRKNKNEVISNAMKFVSIFIIAGFVASRLLM